MGRPTLTAEGEFAAHMVVNGTDIDGLVLRTSPGSTMSGRVAFEGDNPPTRPEVGLRPVAVDTDLNPRLGDAGPFGAGPSGRADVHDDWTFDIAGISGPRRLRLADPPAGWALKAIYLNGADVTDQTFTFGRQDQSVHDLQVVLTNQVTVIEGMVADASGRPVRECLVMAFPSDREARSYRHDSSIIRCASASGSFTIRRLPPGECLVAAVPVARTNWQTNGRIPSSSSPHAGSDTNRARRGTEGVSQSEADYAVGSGPPPVTYRQA
jgi:hypothetical protein